MSEETFVKPFLATLAAQPVQYPNEYQQTPENWLRKVPVLPLSVPPPPQRIDAGSSTSAISVTFKCPKPVASYTIIVQPTDTISAIKTQLAGQPTAPPADAQRLLFKGKALADAKLLKEYSIKDGDTINLMVKPGIDWDPSGPTKPTAPSSTPSPMPDASLKRPALDAEPSSTGSGKSKKHQRIPSVVLSPSPSTETTIFGEKPIDITLTLDTPAPNLADDISSHHAALAAPEFWDRLNEFLRSEFRSDADALLVWEDFLRASKSTLTANEIARIRDHVGVVGMAGT